MNGYSNLDSILPKYLSLHFM